MNTKPENVIKGSLELQSISSILMTIFLHRFSGELEVQRDKVQKRLNFYEGNIVFAASNQHSDRLGDILLEEEKITQQDYDASVVELRKGKKRQGAILVQLGCLTTQDLILAIRHQITIILFSILSWHRDHFSFRFNPEPISETVTLRENTLNLLHKSTESVTSMEWFHGGINTIGSSVSVSQDVVNNETSLRLTPQERRIFQFIAERERTLMEICQWSEHAEVETIKSLHYLLTQNLVEIWNSYWQAKSLA